MALLYWQVENPNGFNTIWQYFGWSNQTLSVIMLWAATVYLAQRRKPYLITLIPALFMTSVCASFLCVSHIAFGLPEGISYTIGAVVTVIALVWFTMWYRKTLNNKQ